MEFSNISLTFNVQNTILNQQFFCFQGTNLKPDNNFLIREYDGFHKYHQNTARARRMRRHISTSQIILKVKKSKFNPP